MLESPTARRGHIIPDKTQAGKPVAGNRHDGFDEVGTGNELTAQLLRAFQRRTRRHSVTLDSLVGSGSPLHFHSLVGRGLARYSEGSAYLLLPVSSGSVHSESSIGQAYRAKTARTLR